MDKLLQKEAKVTKVPDDTYGERERERERERGALRKWYVSRSITQPNDLARSQSQTSYQARVQQANHLANTSPTKF